MKLGMSLTGVNTMLRNLDEATFVTDHNFKVDLVKQGKLLRDKAKEILEKESEQRTGKKYWSTPPKLYNAIKLYIGEKTSYGYETGTNFKTETRKALSISVGPDMRVAPYAEWVEFGHRNWKGYHYLESAYVELAPEISDNISKTLKISLNNFARTANQRTKNLNTGRFVSGFTGMKGTGAY